MDLFVLLLKLLDFSPVKYAIFSLTGVILLLFSMIVPALAATVQPVEAEETAELNQQSLSVTNSLQVESIARDSFTVTSPPPPAPAPPATTDTSSSDFTAPSFTPDPGSAQAYAQTQVQARGWSDNDFNCLVSLWNRESSWRANALNSSSGAYGIPQALPGNKMASAGADWETNANTQIDWGLGYIAGRYGNPCGAWQHSEENNWY